MVIIMIDRKVEGQLATGDLVEILKLDIQLQLQLHLIKLQVAIKLQGVVTIISLNLILISQQQLPQLVVPQDIQVDHKVKSN